MTQCSTGQNTVNDDGIMFDARIVYTLHLPFQVYLFYLSSQLRWIARIFCVGSENVLLNFKLSLVCIYIFSIYLQSPLSLEFNFFYRFCKFFNKKDNMLTHSLTKSNTLLHKNTHDREAAYLTHRQYSWQIFTFSWRTLTQMLNAFPKISMPSESFILDSQLPQVTIFLFAI